MIKLNFNTHGHMHTSDAPIRDFADIPITDYLLADTDNRSDNKIT